MRTSNLDSGGGEFEGYQNQKTPEQRRQMRLTSLLGEYNPALSQPGVEKPIVKDPNDAGAGAWGGSSTQTPLAVDPGVVNPGTMGTNTATPIANPAQELSAATDPRLMSQSNENIQNMFGTEQVKNSFNRSMPRLEDSIANPTSII